MAETLADTVEAVNHHSLAFAEVERQFKAQTRRLEGVERRLMVLEDRHFEKTQAWRLRVVRFLKRWWT